MTNQIIEGDALTVLKTLPDKIVQTCICSPPYWGLRSYKTEPQIWGGREDCEHEWGQLHASGINYIQGNPEYARPHREKKSFSAESVFCSLCGAWRGELGLEPTPGLYVQHIVEIFHELRRILREDGTLWLNMGDSYAGATAVRTNPDEHAGVLKFPAADDKKRKRGYLMGDTLKPKDLCGIPWRVAMALQADGWWLRSDIIWAKPNPMPESCTDRPTRSHEYIFLLTKSGTSQYWTHRDLNGVRKRPQADYRWVRRVKKDRGLITKGVQQPGGQEQRESPVGESDIILEEINIKPEGWTIKNKMGWDRLNLWQGHDYVYDADAVREAYMESTLIHKERTRGLIHKSPKHKDQTQSGTQYLNVLPYVPANPAGRNLRSVWSFPTQSFPDAHFATFPEELVRRCILAGTAEQACPTCGAAWERVTEKKRLSRPELDPDDPRYRPNRYEGAHGEFKGEMGADCGYTESKTLGFRPTCNCENNDGSGRCIALDPFGGSGTVALVALKHGRDHITIELKPEYIKMIEKRLKPLGNKPCPQQVEAL